MTEACPACYVVPGVWVDGVVCLWGPCGKRVGCLTRHQIRAFLFPTLCFVSFPRFETPRPDLHAPMHVRPFDGSCPPCSTVMKVGSSTGGHAGTRFLCVQKTGVDWGPFAKIENCSWEHTRPVVRLAQLLLAHSERALSASPPRSAPQGSPGGTACT